MVVPVGDDAAGAEERQVDDLLLVDGVGEGLPDAVVVERLDGGVEEDAAVVGGEAAGDLDARVGLQGRARPRRARTRSSRRRRSGSRWCARWGRGRR
jgi:hypothetical protein